jgi:UDP-N-acetylmuramate--alanine ligase
VPALAIAEELRASGAQVSFVGTRDRIEAELVPAARFPIEYLNVTGLDRRRPGRAGMSLLRAGVALPRASRLLKRLGADAVLSCGGYVSGPVGLAAAMRGVPLVVAESDSYLGLSNRLLARFARRVCLAFPIAEREGDRYLVTGRPVPKAVLTADRARGRERLGIDADASCLFVFGGSLGARSINMAALEAFARRPPPTDAEGRRIVVLHVSGQRDYRECVQRFMRAGSPAHYRLYDFLENFADALAAADLALARAGGSVFELAAAGTPAVLVPYPHATADHQARNAGWLEKHGAAVVIADNELDPARLSATVGELFRDRDRLPAMARAAHRFARPRAARQVAAEVLAAAAAKDEDQPEAAGADAPWRGRRLHFVGIGGAGMSGLAIVARDLGAEVTGCDRAESPYTDMLRQAGIEPELGHSADHVTAGQELVVSTAVPADVPDLEAASNLGVRLIRRGSLLAEIGALRRLIAVSGTHGKTTTAAMAAHCLTACGLDPGFVVGAELRATGDTAPAANAGWGSGEWLVAEADESDRSFLELNPEVAVLTNVELDHHSTYGSVIELEEAFISFLERLAPPGTAVIWDRPELRRLVPPDRSLVAYEIEDDAAGPELPAFAAERRPESLRASNVRQAGLGTQFELVHAGRGICEVALPVPGRHNVLNALAALGACLVAGCDLEQAARSLARFLPAGRRFEPKGAVNGIRVFDDYAHHPSEVKATLEAARALDPQRLIAVFQPHLYSRTLHLHRELGRELAKADFMVVLDVYPARERPEGPFAGVSGKLVADACADYAGGRPVWWLPTLEEAEAVLAPRLADGDVVVTLGAGDVDRLADRLASRLDGS